jgi:hypothetical protein
MHYCNTCAPAASRMKESCAIPRFRRNLLLPRWHALLDPSNQHFPNSSKLSEHDVKVR